MSRCARYCGVDSAGAYGTDTGRNFLGQASNIAGESAEGLSVTGDLVPSLSNFRRAQAQETIANTTDGFTINLARAWVGHIADEFAPVHYQQPVALYLGRSA